MSPGTKESRHVGNHGTWEHHGTWGMMAHRENHGTWRNKQQPMSKPVRKTTKGGNRNETRSEEDPCTRKGRTAGLGAHGQDAAGRATGEDTGLRRQAWTGPQRGFWGRL